ncbi:MAG: flagellar basal body P-ring protein FlgI [Alphaproteobacteria bacterium]
MVFMVAFLWAFSPLEAAANSRIKDIVNFEGVRTNVLVGYGLVVGLNGTGDNISSIVFTKESLIGMLERLGINTRDGQLQSKNVAAVMVTASLPPFSRQGSTIDVTVSALGDAKSLLGGTLMVTPLVGADGEVYAVAQGQLAVGGYSAQGDAQTVTKGVPTSGRIVNGAIVEREIPFELSDMESLKISLRNPDFTTANRISKAINTFLGAISSTPLDPATVLLNIPSDYKNNIVGLMTEIEQLKVNPDQLAKVIIDEQSGIIVISENVKINEIAIAQGNLTIRVTETPQVSQPSPFSQTGETTTVPRTQIEIDEQAKNKLGVVKTGVNLQELVDGLNALGVGPRDMISILQAIKASGALQADIEVM